jgi:ligand-binding sensor domain-containing protein/CheY-like chemotaxis protein
LILFFYFSGFSFPQGYLVHRYSETDGLPSVFVYGMTQDHQGRMWFATRAGIAVYDGVSWEKFTVSHGLPVPSFSKIAVDRKGRVWALSHPGQGGIWVVYYDNGQWNSFPGPAVENFELSQTTSFVLLEQGEQNTVPTIAVGTENQGILIRYRGKWKHLNQHHGLLSNAVNGIVTIKGKFYTATDKGLSVIDSNFIVDNRLNRQLDLGPTRIKGIAVQHKDKFPDFPLKSSRVWLYGENWIGWFDVKNFKMTRYPLGLFLSGKKRFVNILPDYCCGVYVGDYYSLNYFNYKTGSWQFLDTPNGLIGGGANSLYIDFEKNIWIACERGVSKISSRRFTNFQRHHGLLEDEVTALLEYEPGKFILGHNNGITFYDGKEFLQVPFSWEEESALPVCRVLDIQMGANKDIWLAASWAGLAKVNPRFPRRITWYGPGHSLSRKIICLWIDKHTNRLWVGTETGIFLHTPNHPNAQHKPEFVLMKLKEFPKHNPRRIYGDSGKLRYIAGHNTGVFIYDEQNHRWKNYTVPGDEKANGIYAIKKDSSGRLFIGTMAGLFILENETLKKFKSNGFQVDRPVYFILEDHKKRSWFGTDNGVVCWDGKKVKRYSIKEGLIGQETNRAAAITDTRGRIWIGTNRGVSIYDETFDNSILYNPPPKVQLSHVRVSGKRFPLSQNHPIQLAYQDNTLVFHFRGISFLDETAIRFKNKLEGFESEWSREHYPYQQMIRYLNLPPEVMKRIFEPYFTTKKTGEGSGMGLAVTHGIVKSYCGDISVHSEIGKGTTFLVLLPCIRDTEKQEIEPDSQLKEEIPGGNERILLVDDEAELTEAAKKILEKLGYHVVGKSSSIEALSLFKKAPLQFDIIISDLTMPHMTGLQLAREIKRIRTDIPIIILSGYNLDMTVEQINAFGVSDFISKPIARSKLARVVRRVLDGRQRTEDRGQRTDDNG